MYRTLIPLLLCASTALPAPQRNSNITYVKRQLTPEQRESRIEKVPLTIPGNNDGEPTENKNKNEQSARTNNSQPTYNYSDRIYSIKTKPKINSGTEKNISKEQVEETDNINTDDVVLPEIKDSDILPAESILNDRIVTIDNTGPEADATLSDEFVTAKYEEETTATTVADGDEVTTKAPTPRQLSKQSYFGKSTIGSFSQNLILHPGKRMFLTRCRCEKIWNCAQLQISIARCPEEQFMCC